MEEPTKANPEAEKRVYELLDRFTKAIGVNISRDKYPKIIIDPLNKNRGSYKPSKKELYLGEETIKSVATLGSEFGHWLRNELNPINNKLVHNYNQTLGRIFGKISYFKHAQTEEFFDYLGRRILQEITKEKEKNNAGYQYPHISRKQIMNQLKENRKKRKELKQYPQEGLSRQEWEIRKKEYLKLYEERDDIITHTRPYEFAANIDLDKINIAEIYAMSDKEVRKRFFRKYPKYDSEAEAWKQIKNKPLESRLSASLGILGLLISSFFFYSTFTGYSISNLNNQSSNLIGIISFIVGILGSLFYIKTKHKS